MRYSRCMQADEQLSSLSKIVQPSTNFTTHLVYELGETLYSGPASSAKLKLSKNVNLDDVIFSTAGNQQEKSNSKFCEERVPSCLLNGIKESHEHSTENLKEVNGSDAKSVTHSTQIEKLLTENSEKCVSATLNKNNIVSSFQPVEGEKNVKSEQLGERSTEKNSALVDKKRSTRASNIGLNKDCRTISKLSSVNKKKQVVIKQKNKITNYFNTKEPLLPRRCKQISTESPKENPSGSIVPEVQEKDSQTINIKRSNYKTPLPVEKMVRLIPDPISKVTDAQCPRSRKKRAPKRIQSVDCLDLDDSVVRQRNNKRELRNRSVSCGSDHSESDYSDLDEMIKLRKPKNGEDNSLEASVSQVGSTSNANTNGAIKVNGDMLVNGKIKARRVSRANSDDSDYIAPKVNGISAGSEVDNDGVDINMLLEISPKDRKIFETKKAKIKKRGADWMLITETERYYNERQEILRIKSREDETDTESESSPRRTSECNASDNEPTPDVPSKKGKSKCKKVEKKTLNSDEIAASKVRSSKIIKKSSNKKAYDEDDADSLHSFHDDSYDTQSTSKSRKKDEKPKKRLSDAERFLRDNKEYYQFPETRDRLRRNNSDLKDSPPETRERCKRNTSQRNDSSEKSNEDYSEEETTDVPVKRLPKPKGRCGKNKKGTRRARVESSEDIRSPSPETLNEEVLMDNLYFSFEGPPVKESWYQTYQRYIDGIEEKHFEYQKEALRFILPYEMPKEYLRELQGNRKAFLLARRRSELAELSRKSPRCHASTLALFSDIIPGKKKKWKGKSKLGSNVKAIEEVASSDGTSTPTLEPLKFPLGDETGDEMLYLSQCIDHAMNSIIDQEHSTQDSNLSPSKSVGKKNKKRKKLKRKVSSNEIPVKNVEKYEFLPETKVFDNALACEVDPSFLRELPQYLNEVSILPDNTLEKNPLELLSESCHCDCTERTSCDETSSIDERTELSSESVSLCGSEIVDSSNSSFPPKYRNSKLGRFKKRRKNLTGWPTQKRKKPVSHPVQASDDNDSMHDDEQPKNRLPRMLADRRSSTRKRSSVYYMETWPVRFRNGSSNSK